MSKTKTVSQAMQYELTGDKKGNHKQIAIKAAETLSTLRLVYIVANRHKVGLLAIGNIVLVLNWAIPQWTTIITSLF